MVLLMAAQGLKGAQRAAIVRERETTVLCWLTRDLAEGLEDLHDTLRPGRPSEVTESMGRVARRRALEAPEFGVTVLAVDLTTSGR